MYELEMEIEDAHIDFQGILDSIYYAYYMEECHQQFLKDVLDIDVRAAALGGTNYVITEYTIKFKSPLKKGDHVSVDCSLLPVEKSRARFMFSQMMKRNGQFIAEAQFICTCVPSAGGRSFVPETILAAMDVRVGPK